MSDPQVLYRFYDDQQRLLYVGVTMSPGDRFRSHSKDKPWWSQVATITMEQHPDRETVLHAERAAIQQEWPVHNIMHNARAGDGHASPPQATPGRLVRFRTRNGYERVEPLTLYYEVALDPISDDWTPDEIGAHDLLTRWYQRVTRRGDRLARIYWYVSGPSTFESAVRDNYEGEPDGSWFGDYYTQPYDLSDGQYVTLESLPVIDKGWRASRADKGGFIAEATGWRPNPWDRWVDPETLIRMASGRAA